MTFYLDPTGQPRYRLLETLRAYALEQLVEAGQEAAIRLAHLEWCLQLVNRCEQEYSSAGFPQVLDIIELERHNIRAGLSWSLANPTHVEKGLQVFWMTGEMETAEQLLRRCLEFSRKWNHVFAIGHTQFSYGVLDFLKGDPGRAGERLRESLGLRRDIRDLRGIADCLGALALVSGAGGDHIRSARLLGAADAQREAAGQVLVPWLEPFFDQIRQESRSRLGDERFDQAVEEGRELAHAEAVSLGLDPTGATTPN